MDSASKNDKSKQTFDLQVDGLGKTRVILNARSAASVVLITLVVATTSLGWTSALLTASSQSTNSQHQKAKILEQEAIINLYYKQQNRDLFFVSIIALITTITSFIIRNIFWNSMPSVFISILMFLLVALTYIRKVIIVYRILRGYFGTNRYEASEIIEFIQSRSDDLDSSGGDQMKVFPKEVLEELQAELGLQGTEGVT